MANKKNLAKRGYLIYHGGIYEYEFCDDAKNVNSKINVALERAFGSRPLIANNGRDLYAARLRIGKHLTAHSLSHTKSKTYTTLKR